MTLRVLTFRLFPPNDWTSFQLVRYAVVDTSFTQTECYVRAAADLDSTMEKKVSTSMNFICTRNTLTVNKPRKTYKLSFG